VALVLVFVAMVRGDGGGKVGTEKQFWRNKGKAPKQ
jgi:hypothetical protein